MGATEKIAILKQFVDLVGATGDAMKKITDGFKHLVVAAVQAYDATKARALHARLIEVSELATSLIIVQSTLPETLGAYAGRAHELTDAERRSTWRTVVGRTQPVLERVKTLLEKPREQNDTDFVAEPAYVKLREALEARSTLLQKLMAIDPPATPAELDVVRDAAMRYGRLIQELNAARDELNTYVKALK